MTYEKKEYVAIHPLDDVEEKKVDISKLGPMKLSLAGRIALMSLRIYLIFSCGMAVYYVIHLVTK